MPAPSEQASPAAASPGPVALVGSGEYLEVMLEVDRGLLAGRPARAVLLPTAAAEEGAERVRYWLDLGARHFERLGVEPVPLPVLGREDAAREDFASAVAGAGLIYLSGGNPGYLASVLRESAVWSAIVAAWQAGAALAGCSAGACALTYVADDVRALRVARSRDVATGPAVSAPTGLAAISALAVIPHFDRMAQWVPHLADRYAARLPAKVTVVGIDEDTAIVTAEGGAAQERAADDNRAGRRFTVVGRQSAWVLGRDGGRTEYPSGATLSVA